MLQRCCQSCQAALWLVASPTTKKSCLFACLLGGACWWLLQHSNDGGCHPLSSWQEGWPHVHAGGAASCWHRHFNPHTPHVQLGKQHIVMSSPQNNNRSSKKSSSITSNTTTKRMQSTFSHCCCAAAREPCHLLLHSDCNCHDGRASSLSKFGGGIP